jgi:hypothetical protein
LILEAIARRLKLRRILRENNELYLDRYALKRYEPGNERGLCIYLHNFLSHDEDGHHNHPWDWSFSVVIRGGYTEERFDPESGETWRETHRAGGLNILRRGDYHRIEELHGDTWTLFVCGPLSGKSWGFWMPGRGHVPWRDRLRERGFSV